MPHFRAGALLQRGDLTVGARHIQIFIVDPQGSVARRIARPPYLPGVEREHRNLALESHDENVLRRDFDRRININETLKLRASARGRHRRLPGYRAVAGVDGNNFAVVEAADCKITRDRRLCDATQR